MICFYVSALRDNRIELVRASWKELTISINDVTLSDEGQYTCSLFTMPVKTSKAFLTVLGVPAKPEITGLSRPAQEGEDVTLTCTTSGSKPAADIRWFRNDKEVQGKQIPPDSLELIVCNEQLHILSVCKWYMVRDVYLYTSTFMNCAALYETFHCHSYPDRFSCDCVLAGQKEINATGRSFTVRSTIHLKVDRTDDGAAYTCVVEHIALGSLPHQVTEVLEVHYPPQVQIVRSVIVPQEGQYFKLECVSKGNPLPEPVFWTKDGGELPDVERMIVEGRDLIITTLNKTDNGTYRCEASNHLGTNRDEFTLYVYDPNALTQPGPDHALIGGVVAVVVFITLCFIIVLGRYLARHKGTYLTNEAKGAEDAPDADTAIINAEGNHAHAEEKKEYFI
ncbi:hypothetical protein cypCar_00001683 [Cyprinus carpio]|nr:hypothetical protein cypCar_00001683 [Cyprinus carpio]